MSATIHSFPYRHAGRRLPAQNQKTPVFASKAEYRERSIVNAIVLCFIAAMTVGGIWIFSELTAAGRAEDCLQGGRNACGVFAAR